MKLTKLEHSGIVLEKGGKKLVFDPVEFAATLPELSGVVAIVITHMHSDHLQPERLAAILDRNPGAKIFTPADAAEAILNALGTADVTVVAGGDEIFVGGDEVAIDGDEAAISGKTETIEGFVGEKEGFKLEFFGKDHASVMAGKVPCQNIGVVVDGKLTNPGDSFDLLEMNGAAEALLVPEVAPWAKISETTEFIKLAKPQIVVPVHDGLLSEMGKTIYDNLLRAACEGIGAKFAPLEIGESIEI